MIAYKYDNDGYYACEIIIQPDPLQVDNYLLPKNSTLIQPEFQAGKKCKWNGTEWTYEDIDYASINAAILAKKTEEALARTVFTKVEIRSAFKALGIEETLNTILSSNSEFQTYWTEAQVIDLNYPLTVVAIASLTAEQVQQLKLAIAGM